MNEIIIIIAKYFIGLSGIFYLYALWQIKPPQRKKFIITTIIAFPLSYIVAKILQHFIYDPRPFMVEHIKPLIPHAPGNGFPSDHMLLAMAITSVIFIYNKKLGIVAAVLALLIGTSRVLAHVHHTEDILGSTVIALAVTYLTYFFLNRWIFKKS